MDKEWGEGDRGSGWIRNGGRGIGGQGGQGMGGGG